MISDKSWKVYVHTNKINGKRYVGITSKENPNHRWNNGRGYNENPYFRQAIEKYGWDGFTHEVLYDNLSDEEAKATEQRLIAEWHTQDRNMGYNMTAGGDGSPGFKQSEKTRALRSFLNRKENLSEETIRRRSEGLKGLKFSEEHKRKIGEANSKAILMLSTAGEVIRSFTSARQAEVELGINHSHISQCCHGTRQTTGGYKWSFA